METLKQYQKIILIFILLALADGVIWYQIVFAGGESKNLELYFFDVGQGDSEMIVFPGNVKMIIDGGVPNGRLLDDLARILPLKDRYIDLVLMTHPQLDHFGGFIDLLKNYEIGVFIGNGRKGTASAYGELEKVIQEENIRYIQFKEGDAIKYEDSTISILSPNDFDLKSKELNDTTLVTMLAHGNFKALYTGDIGINVEDGLVKKYDLSAQVLKVGHHGSKFSSGKNFLDAVKSSVAVIEVGKNTYGHPTKQAMDRIMQSGARIMRTDQNGTIKIVPQENKISIYAEKP